MAKPRQDKPPVLEPTSSRTLNLTHPRHAVGWKRLLPTAVVVGPGGAGPDFSVTWRAVRPAKNCLVAQALVTNTGEEPLRVRCIRWTADVAELGSAPALQFPAELQPVYYASENFRGDYFITGTTRGRHYFKPLPHENVELGVTEDFYFPGVFFAATTQPAGALVAAASQERAHLCFRLRGGNGKSNFGFEIEERLTGLEWLEVPPGGSLAGEKIFFAVLDTNDPQQSTDAYYRVLRREGAFAREKLNPLPRQRIWCSWNYGYFENITEDEVVKQLPVIRKRFPSVKFVQIDHGYERVYPETGQRSQIDFLYRTDTPYDRAKFRSGPRELVRRIKEAGLRPATWIGYWLAGSSKLYADHPDWVLLDDMGRPLALPRHTVGVGAARVPVKTMVLDPSVPEVRDYVEQVCKTVFSDWGFEGIKLDFFSFAFECKRIRFRYPGKTAVQYRQWMVDTFRKYLPEDGFLGLCSVAGTGNPLVGAQADYFRCAEDIGEGDWGVAKRIASWCVITDMLLARRPVPPNIDSIGWSAGFDETAWRSWLNLCAVTGMAMEISGDLTVLDEARSERMNRTLELSDPARHVWCADLPYGEVRYPPSIWIAEGRRDDLVAVFNWTDRSRTVDLRRLTTLWPDWKRTFKSVWPEDVGRKLIDELTLHAHDSLLLRSSRK